MSKQPGDDKLTLGGVLETVSDFLAPAKDRDWRDEKLYDPSKGSAPTAARGLQKGPPSSMEIAQAIKNTPPAELDVAQLTTLLDRFHPQGGALTQADMNEAIVRITTALDSVAESNRTIAKVLQNVSSRGIGGF